MTSTKVRLGKNGTTKICSTFGPPYSKQGPPEFTFAQLCKQQAFA